METQLTFGIIVGNRSFFPSHLINSGRKAILEVLEQEGIRPIALSLEETKNGGVSNLEEAERCINLFRSHKDEINGILITLPNFGEEKIIADCIRRSELNVPVLVHAFDDDMEKMTSLDRRDSFCGKLSVCNNLNQYGIPFSLTELHTVDPLDDSFKQDLLRFAAICRVVKGLKYIRVGALGARPTAFNTVRYSEKILEHYGITVDTLDLSEAFGQASRIKDDNVELRTKIEEIRQYARISNVSNEPISRMARLAVVIDRWMQANRLAITAIQCWTSMEQNFGITPCAIMSMMSDKLIPSACETDVTGVLSMYALSLASQMPSALLDWNNNYGKQREKAVFFHCSNLPASFFDSKPTLGFSEIFAGSVGEENAYGTLSGRIKPMPFTYCRISTDDLAGNIKAYVGEGKFTDDPIATFGGYGVGEVHGLQDLLKYICRYNFEHHVAATPGLVADAVEEAFVRYIKWDVYRVEKTP